MALEKKYKLLKKTSRNYILFGLVTALLSLVALFFIIQYVLKDETEDSLKSTVFVVAEQIKVNNALINLPPVISTEISEILLSQEIKDTVMYDPEEEELETFSVITDYQTINNKNYKIVVRTRAVDSEDILLAILGAYAGIFLALLLVQYFMNKRSNSLIWKPFFDNLNAIKTFSLKSNTPLKLMPTDIEEFADLNTEINALTTKVITDYQNLKQFTEDISHEIQTPLAIIQAKIGNLIDENDLTENQYGVLNDIQTNCTRLAVLNKKLILLAKIENQQFDTSIKVDINPILEEAINNFKDLTNIDILCSINETNPVSLDKHLVSVIINNLLSNAIKYTPENGQIVVEAGHSTLVVKNSGDKPIEDSDKIFNRFYKADVSTKSLGLGLAIIKKICDVNGYTITYTFTNNFHEFKIHF